MAESHPPRSSHLGKTLQRGTRLVITSVTVFMMTAILMAGGGVPGLSLRANAQPPITPTQTPGNQNAGREYGGDQSSHNPLAIPTGSPRLSSRAPQSADVFPGATTSLISINRGGDATGAGTSFNKAISEDADRVVLDSYASDLVSGIDNPADPDTLRLLFRQVFMRTIKTGETTQLSLQEDDEFKGGNNDSSFPTISGDGKWAAWVSHATNLVNGVTFTSDNGQIYLRDLTTNTNTLVTKAADGTPGNGSSDVFDITTLESQSGMRAFLYTPVALSADGSVLVYQSTATNLTADVIHQPAAPLPPISQIFAYDAKTGTNSLVSKNHSLEPANCNARYPRVSGDGRYVVFSSCATTLAPAADNPRDIYQVYRVDRTNGIVTILSKTPNQRQYGNGHSLYPAISKDGNTIAFRSSATNIDPANLNLNTAPNIYMANLDNSTKSVIAVTLISHSGPTPANAESKFTALSSDGRYIAFSSNASNLVPNDNNSNCFGSNGQIISCPDVFLYDRVNLTIELISLAADQIQGNYDSFYPSISGEGRYVAFDSFATNLIPGFLIMVPWDNVYVRDRGVEPPKPAQISLDQTALNFGDLGLNGTKTLTLTLTSVGLSDLTVNAVSLTSNDPGVFSVTSPTCAGQSLAPTQNCTIIVAFTQQLARGGWTAGLLINSNDATNPAFNVTISGGGSGPILNPVPSPLDFGNLGAAHQSKSIELTATSTGTSDLQIVDVNLVGSPGLFSITSQGCKGQTLSYLNKASCRVTVTFAQPYPWGTWTGALRFTSNDAEKPILDVPLTGGSGMNLNLPIVFNK